MSDIKIITSNLANEIIPALSASNSVYMVVSFAMASGVRMLMPSLRSAATRGADVKILTGDYLYVTEPAALSMLLHLGDSIEIRLWHSHGRAFHPKAYLIGVGSEETTVIVGSSNLSKSALTTGVEWNLALSSKAAPDTVEQAYQEFMRLFYHEQTVPVNQQTMREYEIEYSKYYARPNTGENPWTDPEEKVSDGVQTAGPDMVHETPSAYTSITANTAQVDALDEIHRLIDDGYDRAMVVMATGLGKTYLAAFLAQEYKRVLFIAHREELLLQAERSFRSVLPNRSMGIFNGVQKDADADCVFASIFTLAMARHRQRFRPDDFDLIVVDEFHHAAAKSYQTLLNFFQPAFLLGLTATPDRADGKDIYALCDGNVAYQMGFIEAIQNGWLSPFQYFGVYDESDYSKVTWLGTRYDEEELAAIQLRDNAAKAVYGAWAQHRQTRTLAFCSSIRQANLLASHFTKRGVRSLSLHSHTSGVSRQQATQSLAAGEIEIVFTVDLFNEGVDIPKVDTLLFVRPTESLTVFTQQIGRGLRLHRDKSHCTIIDLIGNYRNADVKLGVFQEVNAWTDADRKSVLSIPVPPRNCEFHLDPQVIDLIREMSGKRRPRKERLFGNYREVKRVLGHRPSYLELHLHGSSDVKAYRQEFGSYVGFLEWADELSDDEQTVFQDYQPWLREVESTVMTKSYKMIVLLAMLHRGTEQWTEPVAPIDVAPFFHQYLMDKEYRKRLDFSEKTLKLLWDYDESGVSRLIATMPMAKWARSSKGLVTFEGGIFRLAFEVKSDDRLLLHKWTLQVCEYRLHWYFERKAQLSRKSKG
ncbi:DEAD/DEAH box helicase family protein [Alicyclobacillus sp. SO9]|uniref:DEAD/DEAH box helicase family protein n=1 Tax=Alicyclobacillus sp. SO9 TaxID=2665646 RepID=UPI0018E70731|nr:DEAD/DEAH box helicase family protein [Alicyclobacillus sp. SO9]QQE80525.1 DEAD/DEAH box helicase family protein [Alicyclobacillus sp. SO9]